MYLLKLPESFWQIILSLTDNRFLYWLQIRPIMETLFFIPFIIIITILHWMAVKNRFSWNKPYYQFHFSNLLLTSLFHDAYMSLNSLTSYASYFQSDYSKFDLEQLVLKQLVDTRYGQTYGLTYISNVGYLLVSIGLLAIYLVFLPFLHRIKSRLFLKIFYTIAIVYFFYNLLYSFIDFGYFYLVYILNLYLKQSPKPMSTRRKLIVWFIVIGVLVYLLKLLGRLAAGM